MRGRAREKEKPSEEGQKNKNKTNGEKKRIKDGGKRDDDIDDDDDDDDDVEYGDPRAGEKAIEAAEEGESSAFFPFLFFFRVVSPSPSPYRSLCVAFFSASARPPGAVRVGGRGAVRSTVSRRRIATGNRLLRSQSAAAADVALLEKSTTPPLSPPPPPPFRTFRASRENGYASRLPSPTSCHPSSTARGRALLRLQSPRIRVAQFPSPEFPFEFSSSDFKYSGERTSGPEQTCYCEKLVRSLARFVNFQPCGTISTLPTEDPGVDTVRASAGAVLPIADWRLPNKIQKRTKTLARSCPAVTRFHISSAPGRPNDPRPKIRRAASHRDSREKRENRPPSPSSRPLRRGFPHLPPRRVHVSPYGFVSAIDA
ncbi:hypothetical protein V9T40_007388 [Parthenolecanium corni]|uniref:Uncharacterized protein n=1 Tax=Parthenolecanium corni TaxID=536013 RepID=A0AAN9TYJ7_9HEMI